MRIKSSSRKGWIAPQLMWLRSREYIACLAQCTRYHYGWVPYGRANVASYQHLIQIASCSFNEVAIQLGGGCFPEIGKISQAHRYVWCTENIYTQRPSYVTDYILSVLDSLCASALCFSLLRSCLLPQVGPIGLPDARVCATVPLRPLVICDILVCIDKLITSTFSRVRVRHLQLWLKNAFTHQLPAHPKKLLHHTDSC